MKITQATNLQQTALTPMYYRDSEYARNHGEYQKFSDSMFLCNACKSDIAETINGIQDDSEFLDPDNYRPLVQKYGLERVAYTLYNAVGCDYFNNRKIFSRGNRTWAVKMYTPYFLLNNSHPVRFSQLDCPLEKLDHFISAFRNSFNIPLNGLNWEHERGEKYPELFRTSIYDVKNITEAWKWMYSSTQSCDCAHDLSLAADSCLSKESGAKYLTDILDHYGTERVFTILANAALDTGAMSDASLPLSNENKNWIEEYDKQFAVSNIDFAQKGCPEIYNLGDSLSGLNDLLGIAHEIGSEMKNMSKFEPVFLYGAPAFYSPGRLHDYEISDTVFNNCYDLRGSDYDPGLSVAVEKYVGVNYCGSVLSPVRLPIPECGYLKLGENGFLPDEPNVNHDYFYALALSFGDGNLEEGVRENINTENEKLVIQTDKNDLGEDPGCMYGVYRVSDENCQHKFLNYKTTQNNQFPVSGKEYSLIYFSDMARTNMSCDEILQSLRDDPPISFRDYGPYTSDVIVTNVFGDAKAFYVNIDHIVDANRQIHEKVSFDELPDFIWERQAQLARTPIKLLDDQPLDIKSIEEMSHDGNEDPTGGGVPVLYR